MANETAGPSITVRLSNQENPRRKDDFLAVLKKRGANITDVINNFVDAYVKCDGLVTFPISPEALKGTRK